jgi:hypothetical protein
VAPGHVSVITDTITELMEHSPTDAVLVMGLGYMSLRAHGWLRSKAVPTEVVKQSAEFMIAEEAKLFTLIVDLIARYQRPIIPVFDLMSFDAQMDNNPVRFLDSKGIMPYPSPDKAVYALAKVVGYQHMVKDLSSSHRSSSSALLP